MGQNILGCTVVTVSIALEHRLRAVLRSPATDIIFVLLLQKPFEGTTAAHLAIVKEFCIVVVFLREITLSALQHDSLDNPSYSTTQ